MPNRRILAAIPIVIASLLGGCTGSSGSSTSSDSQAGNWDTTFTWTLAGLSSTRIIMISPTYFFTHCSTTSTTTGDTIAILRYDTLKAFLDTVGVRVVGDRLWLGGTTSSVLNTGGMIIEYALLSRVSGTGGVEGAWDDLLQDTLVAVNLPETNSTLRATRAHRDSIGALRRASGIAARFDITSSSLTVHVKRGDWALTTIAYWQMDGVVNYGATLQRVDATTLTFTAKDGSVATAKLLDDHGIEYSSTNPAEYPTYVEYSQVSSVAQCPDNPWLHAFLYAHSKSSAAGRAIPAPFTAPRKLIASGLLLGG